MLTALKEGDSCYNNNLKDCHIIYHKLLNLGKKEKFEQLDFLYYKLSNYYFRTQQEDSALYFANKGLKINKDPNSRESLLDFKASILYNQGKTDSAIHYFVKLADELETNKQETKLAYTYANIGIVLGSQNNNEKSVEYLLKSYDLLEKLEDSVFIATISGNVSFCYYFLKDFEQSKKWAYKTIQFDDKPYNDEGKIISYNTLMKIYLKSDLDSASHYASKGIELARKSNSLLQLGNCLSTYADILTEKNNLPEAQKAIDEAVEVFRKITFIPGLSDALYVAGEISLKNKDYQKATNYLYESRNLNDSLLSEKRITIVNELNTKYETEKKEKLLAEQKLSIEKSQNQKRLILIIALFLITLGLGAFAFYRRNQKIREQKATQEKENEVLTAFIDGEERERNRISHELHDGVASMIGVAKMNMEILPHLPEEKRQEQIQKVMQILDNTHSDIRHIAHNLLPLTLEKEGLIRAIEQFAEEINQTGILKITVIDKTNKSLVLSPQKQLMLFRIIQELVNNTIKHSQASSAEVVFTQNENDLNIQITDNGVGFKKETIKENQGLRSIQQRIASISGRIFLKSFIEEGTQVTLQLQTE